MRGKAKAETVRGVKGEKGCKTMFEGDRSCPFHGWGSRSGINAIDHRDTNTGLAARFAPIVNRMATDRCHAFYAFSPQDLPGNIHVPVTTVSAVVEDGKKAGWPGRRCTL
jgi:hypothetical protein